MTITYHKEMIQNSVEWYDARCGMLTASEFDKILTSKGLASTKTILLFTAMQFCCLTHRFAFATNSMSPQQCGGFATNRSQGDYMAHILQTNVPPQYIPFFRVELLDELFDDAEIEQLEVEQYWTAHHEAEAA